jgi:hypothetical protein
MVLLVGIFAAIAPGTERRDHHQYRVANNSLVSIPRNSFTRPRGCYRSDPGQSRRFQRATGMPVRAAQTIRFQVTGIASASVSARTGPAGMM